VLKWAVAQQRSIVAVQPSSILVSGGRLLAEPPVLNAAVKYQITGALKDGTVRPGMTVGVKQVGALPASISTGLPTPTHIETWATFLDPGPFTDSDGINDRPYEARLVVPRVDRLTFSFRVTNPAGTDAALAVVKVRQPPHYVSRQARRNVESRVGHELDAGFVSPVRRIPQTVDDL
jgi:hypothetical protein